MFLKYVTETTEIGVQVFGMLHGSAFLAYLSAAIAAAIILRWKWLEVVERRPRGPRRDPPLATIPLERWLAHRDELAPHQFRGSSGSRVR